MIGYANKAQGFTALPTSPFYFMIMSEKQVDLAMLSVL